VVALVVAGTLASILSPNAVAETASSETVGPPENPFLGEHGHPVEASDRGV
jgi:hypothetical protein